MSKNKKEVEISILCVLFLLKTTRSKIFAYEQNN